MVWSGQGQDGQWLADLRSDARRELIKRLTLERVREGGLSGTPKERLIPDYCWKLLEAFAIGVGVALTSAYLVHRTGIIKGHR